MSMADDPFEATTAEKQLLANFQEKKSTKPKSLFDLSKTKSQTKKKKNFLSGLNFLHMLNTQWAHKDVGIRTLDAENIVNADIIKAQRGIQPGDEKDLERIDRTGRTVIHRAALEQNYLLITDLCAQAHKKDRVTCHNMIEKKDKFGNTPLLLSCILNISESYKKRAKCIQILIDEGACIDVRNNRTMWSPVMWCAYYGDEVALKILIENGARCHYPDHKGHFPIDKAGMKGHKRVVEIIFRKVLSDIEFLEENISHPDIVFGKYGESDKYLRSPLHRCSLLYWACFFKLDLDLIEKLLTFQDVIPEFPIISQQNKSSIHACCSSGYTEGLELLLHQAKKNRDRIFKKHSQSISGIESMYGNKKATKKLFRDYVVLPLNKEEKKKFKKKFQNSIQGASAWYSMYLAKVTLTPKAEQSTIHFFDGKDMLGNTPLHLASYMGFEKCAALLLKNGANIEAANNEGWLCKELRIHEKINKLYKKHISESLNVDRGLATMIATKVGIELLDFRTLIQSARAQNASRVHPEPKLSPTLRRAPTKTTILSKQAEVNIKNELASFSNQLQIPDVVIKFRIDPEASNRDFLKQRMDFYLQILLKASFDVYLSMSLYEGTYLIMLKMDNDTLSRECAQLGLQMKLVDSYLYQPYDEKRKTEFEPFRSLQRQQIAISVMKKFIDLELLKEQKVISDYFRMHTVAGAEKLRDIWLVKPRWYWPQPLPQMMDYITENKNHTYSAINAMKQYFGEKISFYFAFASFLTCSLLFLALPGAALQIYLFYRLWLFRDVQQMYDTPLVAIWVLYVVIWNTVTVERWKRKNAEIAARWGLINADNSSDMMVRQVRKEFVGDECISGTTGALTKKYKLPITTITFIGSIPVLIILLAGIVGSFLLTYTIKDYGKNYLGGAYSFVFQLVAGLINGFIIAVLTILYSQIARWFVKRENHKYQGYQERSLILKSFTFRFLSSFIGVVWVAFFEQDQKEDQITLWDIFLLLNSLVFTKQAGSIATLTILPWLRYKLNQRKYFQLARRKAIAQASMERHEEPFYPMRSSDSLPTVRPGHPNKDGSKLAGVNYKRAVLDLKRGLANEEWDLSQVELNGSRPKYKDLVDSYGELFVLLGYMTLFASAFPLGPAVALLNSIFDSRFRLYCFLNVLGRPTQERSSGIGYWLEIWEFISITSIFTNLILLYNHVSLGFVDQFIIFNQTTDFGKLFVFVIAEHLLLLLKYVLAVIIPDKPKWVFREEEKHKYMEELEYETIKAREAQLQNTVKEITEALEATKLEQKMALAQKELEIALDTIEKLKLEQKRVEAEQTKKIDNLDLRWAVKTMLHACFTAIERELLIERISDIAEINHSSLVVKCTHCTEKKAIIECKQTRELVCKKCYFTVQSKLNFADLDVSILPFIAGDGEIDPEIKREVERVRRVREQQESTGRTEKNLSFIWKKFEYFSFPTNNNTEQFSELQRIFKLLYSIYITESGIDPENRVTDANKFLKLRIQTSPVSLDPKQSFDNTTAGKRAFSIRSPSDKSVFKGELDYGVHKIFTQFRNDPAFNSEEKLMLNRIAFLVFKRHGANTKFMDFFRLVKGLQEGTFESKIYLFFDLLDEDDDGFISLEDLKRFVRTSYMQSATLKEECERVLEEILEKDKVFDKKVALHKFFDDRNARAIFSSLLQV